MSLKSHAFQNIEKDDVIPFENKIQDEHNNFNINRGIFEAPWDGNFTFISNGFKDAMPTTSDQFFSIDHRATNVTLQEKEKTARQYVVLMY